MLYCDFDCWFLVVCVYDVFVGGIGYCIIYGWLDRFVGCIVIGLVVLGWSVLVNVGC